MAINSSLLIRRELDDYWQVWLGMGKHHPVLDSYGFLVGTGRTRDEAVAEAVANLEARVEELQAPVGVAAEEHEVRPNEYVVRAKGTLPDEAFGDAQMPAEGGR